MKKFFKNLWFNIYWFFKKLTKKGREDYILYQGFAGIQESKKKGLVTKLNVIDSAKKLLKPKKILAFKKGRSITKSKKSNHQLIDQVTHKQKDELNDRGLKITSSGKFKHA
jgi:poly(A) polymerase Pap1